MLILTTVSPVLAKVDIQITGIEGDMLDNARANMSIVKSESVDDLAYVRRLHTLASKEIIEALRPFGYYKATVNADLVVKEDNWTAKYRVNLDAPVRVGAIDKKLTGEARDDPLLAQLFSEFPMQSGDRLNQGDYDQHRNRIDRLLERRGYFDANWSARKIRIDLKRNEADVAFRIDSGRRYHYGEIRIVGSQIRDELVNKHLPMDEGDEFLRDDLLELHGALSTQGWFSAVDVQVDRKDRKDGKIPVTVKLSPRPKYGYVAGAGYGTDTGARGQIGWGVRWITDRGISFDATANLSERANGIRTGFRLPSTKQTVDHYGFTSAYTDERTDTSISQSIEFALTRQARRGPWREVAAITVLDDRFSIGDGNDQENGRSFLVMPGIAWTRVKSDNILFPREGYALTVQTRGASETLFSDTSFLQGSISANTIWPVGERSRLIIRAQLGGSWVQEFSSLPPQVRFFTGGDRSVRGFAYQTIGPTDADGDVVGGRHIAVGSAEYEYLFLPKWGVAAFADTGTAFDSTDEPLRTGVGIGLRWHSPVGPVRIDVASAISEPGNPLRLHLTIGPEL